jgi:hypothetical protein
VVAVPRPRRRRQQVPLALLPSRSRQTRCVRRRRAPATQNHEPRLRLHGAHRLHRHRTRTCIGQVVGRPGRPRCKGRACHRAGRDTRRRHAREPPTAVTRASVVRGAAPSVGMHSQQAICAGWRFARPDAHVHHAEHRVPLRFRGPAVQSPRASHPWRRRKRHGRHSRVPSRSAAQHRANAGLDYRPGARSRAHHTFVHHDHRRLDGGGSLGLHGAV